MPDILAAGRTAGRFGATQLVSIELAALVAASAAYGLPPVAAGIAGGVTAFVLVVTLGRSGGRWIYEAVAARRRLGTVAGFATCTATDRGTEFGVGVDESGWFAAVAVVAPDGLSRDPSALLRLDWLARLAAEPSVPASTLQAVVRQVDGPAAGLDPAAAPAAASYRLLRQALGLPPQRQVWLVARLAPRDAAHVAADRGGGAAGVHKALANTLARLGTGLAEAGLAYRVLDETALRAAVTVACGLPSSAAGPPRELWSRVEAADATHVSFAVRAWAAGRPAAVLAELLQVPGASAVSAAVVFGSVGAQSVVTLVRVAAPPGALAGCVTALLETAGRLGVTLARLNGEQAAGVYATAPTGAPIGLARW